MRELINMHMHTSSSDGEYDVKKLFEMIKQTNLKTISITDHDTIDAYHEIKDIDLEDITVINGCEFSAKPWIKKDGARLHILGYDMDLENKDLHNILKQKRENNYHNFFLQLEYLKKDYSISFPKEEYNKIIKKHDFGRPDIALLLLKYGYVKNLDEAFQKYLNPIFIKSEPLRRKIEAEDIFDVIKRSNGYISIAHIISNRLSDEEIEKFLTFAKENKVDALELYHPNHDASYRNYLLKKIKKYDFLISGGTDYHGPHIKPERLLENNTYDFIKIKKLSLCDQILKKNL